MLTVMTAESGKLFRSLVVLACCLTSCLSATTWWQHKGEARDEVMEVGKS